MERENSRNGAGDGFHSANKNTLGEWSDGDDDWVWDVNENISWEWSDSDDNWVWDVDEDAQTGRGEKRKSSVSSDEINTLPEENFYVIENVKQIKSKKFRTTAMNYSLRFNNSEDDLDLIESYERTQGVFEQLLNDITGGMNEKDQVRFVLRSTQLDTPISLPFMPVLQLTPERVFSQIERVIQSNRDFRLDTVVVDLVHVEAPQGKGKMGRVHLDIKEFLRSKRSVVTIYNKDDLCLARALVMAIAKIEKDPKYKSLKNTEKRVQEKRARELHRVANVPLGLWYT